MDGRKFYEQVSSNDELEWRGATTNDEGVDCAYIRCTKNGCTTEVPISEIGKHDWEVWLDLFLGRRDAKIMSHVTRIVGYYSELKNWNSSKIAELADRHKGEYAIPERKPAAAPEVHEPEPELAIA